MMLLNLNTSPDGLNARLVVYVTYAGLLKVLFRNLNVPDHDFKLLLKWHTCVKQRVLDARKTKHAAT